MIIFSQFTKKKFFNIDKSLNKEDEMYHLYDPLKKIDSMK